MLISAVNCARTPPFARAEEPRPTAGAASSTVTSNPAPASSRAHDRPITPAPITATSVRLAIRPRYPSEPGSAAEAAALLLLGLGTGRERLGDRWGERALLFDDLRLVSGDLQLGCRLGLGLGRWFVILFDDGLDRLFVLGDDVRIVVLLGRGGVALRRQVPEDGGGVR